MAARNGDGSYDAVDSGGFGKDYHGQDAFGGRIGGTGIGGSHFGGKAAGDFSGEDESGEGHFTERYTDYEQVTQTEAPEMSAFESEEEAGSGMRDSIRGVNEETSENSNTGSTMDTSFQIGGIEEEEPTLEEYQQRLERAEVELNKAKEQADKEKAAAENVGGYISEGIDLISSSSRSTIINKIAVNLKDLDGKVIDSFGRLAEIYGYDDFDRKKIEDAYKEKGPDALRDAKEELFERIYADIDKSVKGAQARRDILKYRVDNYKSSTTDKTKTSFTDKTKTSFTDKMKPSKTESKPSKTESKPSKTESKPSTEAKPSPSDYYTKANKDSAKELAPSRNDFGNHATDTLKGAIDIIADNSTADALGLKSIEEFAKENGYNPDKLSTMKAYLSYQNKQIMKAIPGIVKQIGSYITERVKDAVDPSQLPERIRNTLARYNLATLVGAAILSIQSGAGIQASIDQALTMVDPEDKVAVSDYLEDVLNDEGTVNDLSNAFDDALAPEQNSVSNELDESIASIGRKDNTDYSGFNAGISTSGTTSDADVKVFIARNVKSDPILRKMISKIGK